MSEDESDINRQRAGYKAMLLRLKVLEVQLGLNEKPSEITTIPLKIGKGHPSGAPLPVYPSIDCGTTEGRFERTLFNLVARTEFTPPEMVKINTSLPASTG